MTQLIVSDGHALCCSIKNGFLNKLNIKLFKHRLMWTKVEEIENQQPSFVINLYFIYSSATGNNRDNCRVTFRVTYCNKRAVLFDENFYAGGLPDATPTPRTRQFCIKLINFVRSVVRAKRNPCGRISRFAKSSRISFRKTARIAVVGLYKSYIVYATRAIEKRKKKKKKHEHKLLPSAVNIPFRYYDVWFHAANKITTVSNAGGPLH